MCQPANIQIVSRILHIVMLIEVTRLFKAIKIFSALLRPAARPQRGVTAVTIFIRQPRRVTLIAGYWIPTLHVPTCPTWPRVLVPLSRGLVRTIQITTLQHYNTLQGKLVAPPWAMHSHQSPSQVMTSVSLSGWSPPLAPPAPRTPDTR